MPQFLKDYVKTVFTFVTKATFVFILVLISIYVAVTILFDQTREVTTANLYRVEGMAEREVTPDVINLTIGSQVRGKDIVKIQSDANDKINTAVDAIEALGIPKENIKTSSYNVNPVYDYEDNTIKEYSVNIEVRVKIEDVTLEDNLAGDVIAVSATSGLNEVRSLSYDISNREDILEDMKLEAVEDAKAKKDRLADAAGLRLGDLKSIEDGYNYPYYYDTAGYAREESLAVDAVESAPSVNISPGESELTVTVTLVYEIL